MTEPKNPGPLGTQQWVALLVIGLGIGWLLGHSASPVLAGVLTSLMGLVVGIVAGLRSVRQKPKSEEPADWITVDARPAALLILGVAFAATGALVVKAHRLLEPMEIREAVLQAVSEGRMDVLEKAGPYSALLFKLSQSECNAILGLKGNENAFVDALEHSSLRGGKQLAARIDDHRTLVTVVEVLCEGER